MSLITRKQYLDAVWLLVASQHNGRKMSIDMIDKESNSLARVNDMTKQDVIAVRRRLYDAYEINLTEENIRPLTAHQLHYKITCLEQRIKNNKKNTFTLKVYDLLVARARNDANYYNKFGYPDFGFCLKKEFASK